MKDILIATLNRGKAEEIREIFKNTSYNLKFLFEFNENIEINENAKSFEGNALIKAILVGDKFGILTLADDSGLSIDALDGRPGVKSARYSGTGDDKNNYEKVLAEMKNIPFEKRTGRYTCAVAIYDPKTKFIETVFGNWDGHIALEPRGTKSFGYAPIFLAEDFSYIKTNAECDPSETIGINHRGKAFRQAIEILDKYHK